MSIDMSGSESTDYSDFDVQLATFEAGLEPQGQGARIRGKQEVEPLQGRGGLSNNEVAELVAMELQVGVETEDESGDQDVGSQVEVRGVIGANLGAELGNFPVNAQAGDEGFIFDSQQANENRVLPVGTITDNAYFAQFQTYAGIAFDDGGSGAGGSYSGDQSHQFRNWRELTNRGPILDQNDDITVLQSVIASDSVITVSGVVRATFWWDVAETSDAGRRFSVPMD